MMARAVTYERLKADGMAALSPPEQYTTKFDEYVRILRTLGVQFSRALAMVREGRAPKLPTKAQDLKTREEELAVEMNLRGCLEGMEAFARRSAR